MTKWRCGYDTRNYPATSLLQGIDAFGTPQPFDSTNGRQTAFVGSKVLCYLLGTTYMRLQLKL
jgi:hypothetical protein